MRLSRPPKRRAAPSSRWLTAVASGLLLASPSQAGAPAAATFTPITDPVVIAINSDIVPPPLVNELFGINVDSVEDSVANTDSGQAVALDAANNLFVAGGIASASGGGRDFGAVSVTMMGAERWTFVRGGSAGSSDLASDVAVGPTGDAYVVGRLNETVTGLDFAVFRLAGTPPAIGPGAAGVEVWSVVFDGGASGDDRGQAIVIDSAGAVIVAGTVTTSKMVDGDNDPSTPDVATMDADILICKLDAADGSMDWCTTVDGTGAIEVNEDEITDILVDSNDDIFISGSLDNVQSGSDFSVMKIAGADGALIWSADLDGLTEVGAPDMAGEDRANAIALDGDGNILATGFSVNANTGQDMTVVKFDGRDLVFPPAPREIWRLDMDFDGPDLYKVGSNPPVFDDDDDLDFGAAVAVDSNGDVFVGGSVDDDGNIGFFSVVKLDGRAILPPPPELEDEDLEDPTLPLFPDEPRVIWREDVNGSFAIESVVTDILVNANDDPIAVGTLDEQFSIVKLDGDFVQECGLAETPLIPVVNPPNDESCNSNYVEDPTNPIKRQGVLWTVDWIGELDGDDIALDAEILPNGYVVAVGELRQVNSGGRDTDMTIVNVPEPGSLGAALAAAVALIGLRARSGRRRSV